MVDKQVMIYNSIEVADIKNIRFVAIKETYII